MYLEVSDVKKSYGEGGSYIQVLKSFGGISDDMKGSVKFIIKTDLISK